VESLWNSRHPLVILECRTWQGMHLSHITIAYLYQSSLSSDRSEAKS
jgi:hypothetical protein